MDEQKITEAQAKSFDQLHESIVSCAQESENLGLGPIACILFTLAGLMCSGEITGLRLTEKLANQARDIAIEAKEELFSGEQVGRLQ